MKPLGIAVLRDLAIATAQKEGVELSKEVAEKVAEYAEGSARKALVLLHQILFLEDEEAQLGALEASDTKRQAIELARLLIKPRVQWSEVAKLLKGLDEDAESLRRMILGYCSAVLLGGGKLSEHAAAVMDEMRDHLYDSGKPGLVLCCYRAVHR